MTTPSDTPSPPDITPPKKRNGCLVGCGILTLILIIIGVTILITLWSVKRQIDPAPMEPTVLNPAEEIVLEQKIDQFNVDETEDGIPAERLIEFTEKELNALIAKSTDFGEIMKVDLESEKILLRVHVPVPEDSPFLGGKNLRTSLHLSCLFDEADPEIILRKVSLGGISLPNAWTGYRKNKNLVGEFREQFPQFETFLDGIQEFSLQKDRVRIVLKE